MIGDRIAAKSHPKHRISGALSILTPANTPQCGARLVPYNARVLSSVHRCRSGLGFGKDQRIHTIFATVTSHWEGLPPECAPFHSYVWVLRSRLPQSAIEHF